MINKLFSAFALVTISLLLTCAGRGFSQGNHEFIKATTTENISLLMEQYAPDAVCMPEYHNALYGKKDIQRYYETRFKASTITEYTRTLHDSHQAGKYVIESGTFSYTYTLTGKAPLAYTGKYLIVWKENKKHELKIVSEIWGSDSYLERTSLIFPENNARAYKTVPAVNIRTDVEKQITDRNMLISDCVKARDGATLATTYEEDAIYMPYYSPMLIGKEKITQYYLEHEDPAVKIDSVAIRFSRVQQAGDYAIVDGYYGVKWQSGDNAGIVTGKSINIWRRNKEGVFMLYRQMTNHD